MINSYFLLFKDFSGYEMIFPAFILRKTNVITVSEKKERIVSEETLNFTPDMSINEIDVDKVDVLVIPGGNTHQHLKKGSAIQTLLEQLHSKKKLIAAICGGPVLLANTDILENKNFTAGGGELPESWQKNFTEGNYVKEDVVVDGNVITAKGVAVAKFAVTIGKQLGIFSSKEDEKREYEMIQKIR